MTKQTKKADKPSKAGAVELTEERLDTVSGGINYKEEILIETYSHLYSASKPVSTRTS